MPAPRVFVSSTFYDLKYIRENLKYFVSSLGYEPVLSEEGGVYYHPEKHVHEAAVAEVPSCQMLVIIIGGRFGTAHVGTDVSITNNEYRKAVEQKIPIFALVETGVYEQFHVYRSNRDNPGVDPLAINYAAVDSPKVLDFIEEVQGQAFNNALVPFADFEDIRTYLLQQWASMMFMFLTSRSEAERVVDTLSAVTDVSQKIEFLTRQVLKSVGDKFTEATVGMYDILLKNRDFVDLTTFVTGESPSLDAVVRHKTLDKFIVAAGIQFTLRVDDDSYSYGTSAKPDGSVAEVHMTHGAYEEEGMRYRRVRAELLKKLKQHAISLKEYVAREQKT